MPYQIQVRHLCNLLQIQGGDIDKVIEYLGDVEPDQDPRLRKRAQCAWNWVTEFAPEDFQFSLRDPAEAPLEMGEAEVKALRYLKGEVEGHMAGEDEKTFSTRVYDAAREAGLESSELFPAVYRALIGKEKGPRLVSFLYAIGPEKVAALLGRY